MQLEQIESIVIQVLAGTLEPDQAAAELDIDQQTFDHWLKAFRAGGLRQLKHLARRRDALSVAVVSARPYDQRTLDAALPDGINIQLEYFSERLDSETAGMVAGFDVVCAFVNDRLDRKCLERLVHHGIRAIALRCAGFNQVDIKAAAELGLVITRVPGYSPEAVAEHALMLMLALNRKIIRTHRRVFEGNFALEGLLGFNMNQRTLGIVGTGRIGTALARMLNGFHCHRLAYDPQPNPECEALGCEYVGLDELIERSHIISLHCPLNETTHHMINPESLQRMRDGVMIINTGRGALIDTRAIIEGLKTGKIGYLGLDVYEQEEQLFFQDHSAEIITDDIFQRLLTFPNVLITGHQGFFTDHALKEIAETVMGELVALAEHRPPNHAISVESNA
ncbi:MAG: NAD(P)-dependent oxidoreductase [Pseudomonadota bacterium]